MARTQELVNRLKTVASTKQLTQAMKMVAAAKLGQAERKLLVLQHYVTSLRGMLHRFLHHSDLPLHSPLCSSKPLQAVWVLLMSTDKGLCGAFNKHLFHRALQLQAHYTAQGQQVTFLPIGHKGLAFLQQQQLAHQATYVDLAAHPTLARSTALSNWLTTQFLQGTYQRCVLLYQGSKVVAKEHVRTDPLLPMELPARPAETGLGRTYVYEPSQQALPAYLMPQLLRLQLYQALCSSQVHEHSARMMTMSQAVDNADILLKDLRLSYNRTRQATITKEIIEIAAGAEAFQ